MKDKKRIVIDTNVLISAAFFEKSIPWQVVQVVFADHIPIFSEATFQELKQVLRRDKFKRYASLESRNKYLTFISQHAVYIPILKRYELCRDPKDNKFLEVAFSGHAEYLISGDDDLIVLSVVDGVKICSPKTFFFNFVKGV